MTSYLDKLNCDLRKLDHDYAIKRDNLVTEIEQQTRYSFAAETNQELYQICENCNKIVPIEMTYRITIDRRANCFKTKVYCSVKCHYYDQYDISV